MPDEDVPDTHPGETPSISEGGADRADAVLHVDCAAYLADQVRGLKALDVTELIAAGIRRECGPPRSNGEMVQRLIDLIADLIEMQPYNVESATTPPLNDTGLPCCWVTHCSPHPGECCHHGHPDNCPADPCSEQDRNV